MKKLDFRRGMVLTVVLACGMSGFSQKVIKQRLDSLVQDNGSKAVWFYDAYGNDTLNIEYINNQFSQKWERKYDADNNMIMYAEYRWYNNSWTPGAKKEYEYDMNKNIIVEVFYTLTSTPNGTAFVKDYKYEYDYNSDGNIDVKMRSFWDKTNNMWEKHRKCEYEYDAYGNQVAETIYDCQWNSTTNDCDWTYLSNITYTNIYDDNGRLTSRETGGNKYEWEYDLAGKQTMYSSYYWSDIINDWVKQNKYEYEYDSEGNLTREIRYYGSNNQWFENFKYEYAYDNVNNRTEYMKYNYGVPTSKVVYEYNQQYNMEDLILSNWGHTYYDMIASKQHMFVGEKNYSWDGSDWVLGISEVWYYSPQEILTNIVEAGREDIKIYPNPTKNVLHIVLAEAGVPVRVYDIYGREAPLNPPKGGKLPSEGWVGGGSISIDVSHLANGLYFLKIGNKTVKIIKE